MAQVPYGQIGGPVLLEAGGGEGHFPQLRGPENVVPGPDVEHRLGVLVIHHRAPVLVPADAVPGGLGHGPDGGQEHAALHRLAGQLLDLLRREHADQLVPVGHGAGGHIAPIAVGEHQDLLRRAVLALPDQRPASGEQVAHAHDLFCTPGAVGGLLRHLQRPAAGQGERGVLPVDGRAGGQGGQPGDFTELRGGGVRRDVAHDGQGVDLGRHTQSHHGAGPDVEGVPLLHLLQVQGQARGRVHRRGLAGVDHHLVQGAVPAVVFQIDALPLPGGDLAPNADEDGGLLRGFPVLLSRQDGDAEGGQGRQGQQYAQQFLHDTSSLYCMVNGYPTGSG